jgi:phosphoglycolate phosphatase
MKYVVMDFDGTIADSKEVVISLYNELAGQKGYKHITAENIEKLRGMGIPGRCKYLGIPLYKIPFIVSAILRDYNHAAGRMQFNGGMKEVLLSLAKKGIPYAILSTNSKKNIEAFFKAQDTEAGVLYCSKSVFGKDILLRRFLKDYKLKAADILYIGDESRDVTACRKTGVKIAWVSWGYDAYASLHNNPPDYVINTPPELLSLIESLSQ